MSSRRSVWFSGARPRTLGASITPVVVGTAAAGHASAWRFVAALLVGLGLNAIAGLWWADPLAALFIAGVAAKEGRESWRGEGCAESCC